MSKGVRFAESASLPSPPAAAARAIAAHTNSITLACGPEVLDIKFGFLLLSGIYTTDLTLDWPVPGGQQQQRQHPAGSAATPPPQVRGLTASNLSVAVEPGAAPGQQRLVLRLWADREGPFEERFALGLPPGQEVEVCVTATVLSRKKGTPGLKPHVHLLGFSADTDTEAASDWQGFA